MKKLLENAAKKKQQKAVAEYSKGLKKFFAA